MLSEISFADGSASCYCFRGSIGARSLGRQIGDHPLSRAGGLIIVAARVGVFARVVVGAFAITVGLTSTAARDTILIFITCSRCKQWSQARTRAYDE